MAHPILVILNNGIVKSQVWKFYSAADCTVDLCFQQKKRTILCFVVILQGYYSPTSTVFARNQRC